MQDYNFQGVRANKVPSSCVDGQHVYNILQQCCDDWQTGLSTPNLYKLCHCPQQLLLQQFRGIKQAGFACSCTQMAMGQYHTVKLLLKHEMYMFRGQEPKVTFEHRMYTQGVHGARHTW